MVPRKLKIESVAHFHFLLDGAAWEPQTTSFSDIILEI